MAWERENAAEEFETMLRRHLARSGGRGASCEGFDAERASAYVEDALSSAVRLRYEDHLAGCASCRRAVIELRRMMPEVETATAPVRTPNRLSEWWAGVRQSLAAAPWRWGTAAAAGAFAVLLAVVLIPLRQDDALPAESIAGMSAPAPNAAPGDVSTAGAASLAPQQSGARADLVRPVASSQTGAAGQTGQAAATQPERRRSGVPMPTPPVVPMTGPVASTVAVNSQTSIAGRAGNPPGEAPAAAPVPLIAAAPAPPPAPAAAGAGEPKAEAEKAAGETVAENKPEAKSEVRSESRNQAPRSAGTSAFVPRRQPKNAKRQSAAAAAGDDETVKPMTRKVRDKTFRYENGRWIDSEFKPEFLPPRTRLDRNSADFERALAEHPDLKPFFDLGHVIVVWKGKVYEVR